MPAGGMWLRLLTIDATARTARAEIIGPGQFAPSRHSPRSRKPKLRRTTRAPAPQTPPARAGHSLSLEVAPADAAGAGCRAVPPGVARLQHPLTDVDVVDEDLPQQPAVGVAVADSAVGDEPDLTGLLEQLTQRAGGLVGPALRRPAVTGNFRRVDPDNPHPAPMARGVLDRHRVPVDDLHALHDLPAARRRSRHDPLRLAATGRPHHGRDQDHDRGRRRTHSLSPQLPADVERATRSRDPPATAPRLAAGACS